MSRRVPAPSCHVAESRLRDVLTAGLGLQTHATNATHATYLETHEPPAGAFAATSGYWATQNLNPNVYDVRVARAGAGGGEEVAVVAFHPPHQTQGAVVWQVRGDARRALTPHKHEIQAVAREFARQNTGWLLV
jgi:hypothetical protein